MENELEAVVRHLAERRWPFRLHATYDESISRFLDVFERVHRDVPLTDLRWLFDHAETITPRNIERVRALGGGIAIQHRMAFQGEYFVDRYGADRASHTPPIRRMLDMGVPVGAGTDATRVANHNPWIALSWLVTGDTVGGLRLYPEENRLDRTTALKLFTQGSAWVSREEDVKGRLTAGQYADFAVLSADYFSIPDREIRNIVSLLTVVNGTIVYGAGEWGPLAPALPPVSPEWSPVNIRAGAQASAGVQHQHHRCVTPAHGSGQRSGTSKDRALSDVHPLWGPIGCSCWAY